MNLRLAKQRRGQLNATPRFQLESMVTCGAQGEAVREMPESVEKNRVRLEGMSVKEMLHEGHRLTFTNSQAAIQMSFSGMGRPLNLKRFLVCA
jgi:hypothetical protein